MTGRFWRMLGRVLRLPKDPPDLPVEDPADVERLHPARGYLWYLVTVRWLSVGLAALGLLATSILLSLAGETAGIGLALLSVAVLTPAVGAALHLVSVARFRTTWFAVGRNSLRIRRGLWKITESTITYSNVQNVLVEQGPIQRVFGFSSVKVETAGGSSKGSRAKGHPGLHVLLTLLEVAVSLVPGGAAFGSVGAPSGIGGGRATVFGTMEGLGDPAGVRTTIMNRVRCVRDAGLGDADRARRRPGITRTHVSVLREIRDLLGTWEAG